MRVPRVRFTVRRMMIAVGLTGLLIAVGLRWYLSNQYRFNGVVTRAVPKGSTLAHLESVAGRAVYPASTNRLALSMRRMVEADPAQYPDGWEEGDFWACYDFPDGNRWWFQVRNRRLVNYDPAVLASQPQTKRPILLR